MPQWTIEAPTSLEFDDVTGLRVRLIAGSVAVLATDGKLLSTCPASRATRSP